MSPVCWPSLHQLGARRWRPRCDSSVGPRRSRPLRIRLKVPGDVAVAHEKLKSRLANECVYNRQFDRANGETTSRRSFPNFHPWRKDPHPAARLDTRIRNKIIRHQSNSSIRYYQPLCHHTHVLVLVPSPKPPGLSPTHDKRKPKGQMCCLGVGEQPPRHPSLHKPAAPKALPTVTCAFASVAPITARAIELCQCLPPAAASPSDDISPFPCLVEVRGAGGTIGDVLLSLLSGQPQLCNRIERPI